MAGEYRTPAPIEAQAAANFERLRENPYPGRGIVMGLSEDGLDAIQIYWVMGRSDNSRNRILKVENELVKTAPFDASKVQDPSLIIYTAMREVGGMHIVSNGDQTDTAADLLEEGTSFEEALYERTYEPDAPNFTPRITGFYYEGDFGFSVIKKGEDSTPIHDFYFPDQQVKGIGHAVHTYKGDGNPLPSFDQPPYPVPLVGYPDEIAKAYWEVLNPENRVALAVKAIDPITSNALIYIINRHEESL